MVVRKILLLSSLSLSVFVSTGKAIADTYSGYYHPSCSTYHSQLNQANQRYVQARNTVALEESRYVNLQSRNQDRAAQYQYQLASAQQQLHACNARVDTQANGCNTFVEYLDYHDRCPFSGPNGCVGGTFGGNYGNNYGYGNSYVFGGSYADNRSKLPSSCSDANLSSLRNACRSQYDAFTYNFSRFDERFEQEELQQLQRVNAADRALDAAESNLHAVESRLNQCLTSR